MPSIDENHGAWHGFPWHQHGDEWSVCWGGSLSLWRGTLWPRIADDLPTGHILEIAPGHGRITQFLLPLCSRYTGVDLVATCVDHCRARFVEARHASFVQNDGRSLAAIEDDSIDFALSWDSLVHADMSVLDAYLAGLSSKLRPGARAFLHHSNLGAYRDKDSNLTVANPHWRDESVDADAVRDSAMRHGLHCVSQELIQWAAPEPQDCFTLIRRPAAGETLEQEAATQRSTHPNFGAEIEHFRRLAGLYHRDQPVGR